MPTRRTPPRRLYFAYGSNLSLRQMATRCPGSTYVGRAVLPDYRWQINQRGYANVVPAPGFSVHGLVYELGGPADSSSTSDEARLDRSEGVHSGAYSKALCDVLLYPAARRVKTVRAAEDGRLLPLSRGNGPSRVEGGVLVYLSEDFVRPGSPRDEYIDRMNVGVRDAVALGVPAAYFANAVRPSVPDRPDLRLGRRVQPATQRLAEPSTSWRPLSRARSLSGPARRTRSMSLGEPVVRLGVLEAEDERRRSWTRSLLEPRFSAYSGPAIPYRLSPVSTPYWV